MHPGNHQLEKVVIPTSQPRVYLVAVAEIDPGGPPLLIDGRPVTAVAPHPEREDLVYLTTDVPETLDFLPDPITELADP